MHRSRVLPVSLVALTLAACGGSSPTNHPIQPQYEPQIVNLTDTFEFQLTGVDRGDGALSYTWQNTGPRASIDRSSAISAGVVSLTLKDAAGATVYDGPLNGASGSVTSADGTAGAWTVAVDFADATGTINFRCQKN